MCLVSCIACGGEPRLIDESLSPDGEFVAFLSRVPTPATTPAYGRVSVGPRGSRWDAIDVNVSFVWVTDFEWEWTLDGRQLNFTADCAYVTVHKQAAVDIKCIDNKQE